MAGVTMRRILWLIVWLASVTTVHSFIEGLYCGKDNCYDILEVTRDNTRSEITKAYRRLAKQWHPDRHKTKEEKEKAAVMFQRIANAYEILRDEEQRTDYDYMLDNPDEYYSIYFRYYQHRLAPKVDVRIVIVVTISVISIVQYYAAWSNYKSAIDYLCKEPKYRTRAMEIAKAEGLLDSGNSKKNRRSKEEKREEQENAIRSVIENNMDIRGGYSKPSYMDVLWVQLVLLPWTIARYLWWWGRWLWLFTICRNEYGEEEKHYLIRRYMKCSKTQWDSMDDHEKEEFMKMELWKWEKFSDWKQQREDEMKSKLAENARYKSYRRYLKKGGPGQITFGPD